MVTKFQKEAESDYLNSRTPVNIKKSIGEVARSLSNLGGVGSNDSKIVKETEASIATAMADAISAASFRRGEGGFFYYEDTRYIKVEDDVMRLIVLGLMRELNIGKVYMFGSVSGTVAMVKNDSRIEDFEPSRSLISFRNKLLNVSTMTTHAHGPQWMTRIFLDFEYDVKATCPEWENFLTYVIPDYPSRLILQEFLGLMFIDNDQLSIEAAMFLYGTGANGKSVVQYVIQSILGDDYCSNYELSQLCASNDSGYNLADVNGKLLNFAADMGDKDFSGGRFKAIASREPIQVRPIGQAPFKAKDMPLLVSNINKIPTTTDSTDGYWRRFKLIHFSKTISEDEQDKTLKPKLRTELSGIFNWILVGRRRILENKGHFTKSPYMNSMVHKAREDSNSVLSYLSEKGYCGVREGDFLFSEMRMFSKELMKDYVDYCAVWRNTPKSKTNFLTDLKMAGFRYDARLRIGTSQSCGFTFFKMNNVEGEEFADAPMLTPIYNPDGAMFNSDEIPF